MLGVGTKAQSVLADTQTYNTMLETPLGWRILAQLMFVGVVIETFGKIQLIWIHKWVR